TLFPYTTLFRSERPHILVGELGEMIVGEHWKEMRTVARDAFMHRTPERCLRPGPDPGLRIGRDVGRIDDAERSCKGEAAGELLCALGRVTLRTIAATRKR